MSDYIPNFKVNNRVRMMQTPLAEMTGMANKRGTVVEVGTHGDVMVDFSEYGQIRCNAADLMIDLEFGPPDPPRPARRTDYA